jgi:16S rRNA A1518/A1519 N6-dimethyltransferase RsmA/KsgA/DIM1 with predicted DNA glycosylase/AP lyase activity
MPPPEVTSAVVRLDVNTDVTSDSVFVDFVHNCFRYRRKTLRKNLQMMGFELDTVVSVLAKLELSATLRAEALELDMFKRLYLLLY